MRHGKSDWPEDMPDFDRTLTDKGRAQAEKTARCLIDKNVQPDYILSSAASRAKETAGIVGDLLGVNIHTTEKLFNAPESEYFTVIRNLDSEPDTLMLVGHNNGISNFANSLSEEIIHFSTASAAVYTLPVTSWKDLEPEVAECKFYYDPDKSND